MSYITNQARFISLISTSLLFACGDSDKQNLNSSSNDGSQPSSETSTEPSGETSSEPSEEVSSEPSEEVSSEPSEETSSEPSEEASSEPSAEVSTEPSEEVSSEPSEEVSTEPSEEVSAEPSGEDSGGSDTEADFGVTSFENDGDVIVKLEPDEGEVLVDLTDVNGDSNTDQEFYMMIVNKGDEDLVYSLQYIPKVVETSSFLSWAESTNNVKKQQVVEKIFEKALDVQLSAASSIDVLNSEKEQDRNLSVTGATSSDIQRMNPMELRQKLDEQFQKIIEAISWKEAVFQRFTTGKNHKT